MATKYNYTIEVSLTPQQTSYGKKTPNVPYYQGGGKTDKFTFSKKGFTIEAKRSKKYQDGSILGESTHSFNGQILKGLLYCYSVSPKTPSIKKLSITLKQPISGQTKYSECDSIIQPIPKSCTKVFYCTDSNISTLFEENDKGHSVRVALSYWLKANNTDERYYVFDHLWRAFNSLYSLHSQYRGQERQKLENIIQFIRNNPTSFQKSANLVNAYTDVDLRKFRWYVFFRNISNQNNGANWIDSLVRDFHDSRFLGICDNLIKDSRIRTPLTTAGLDTGLENYIRTEIANRTINDLDLVILLGIKYAYKIRCRFFHGETSEGTFKIKENRIDKEIDIIKEILNCLVFELLECNQNL